MPTFGSTSAAFKKYAPNSGVNKTPTKKKSTVGQDRPSVVPKPYKATDIVPSPVGQTPPNIAGYGNGSAAPRFSDGGGNATTDSTLAYRTTGGPSTAATGLPPNGTNPYTGYASQFDPGALQSSVWRDPQLVLNAMFQDQGQSTASPMYSTLRDFYGADPQSLWLLTQGNKAGNFQDAGDYANFLNSMYSNYMTPGGRAFDFNEILGILGGLGDQSGQAAQDQSPLWQLLTSGGPAEQVRSMYGLMGDAARVGLPPAMASAFMDSLARQSDSYLAQAGQSSTPIDPYYQWYQNPMLG